MMSNYYIFVYIHNSTENEVPKSPVSSTLKASDMKTYGSRPIEEDVIVLKCKVCSKPILASNFAYHKG